MNQFNDINIKIKPKKSAYSIAKEFDYILNNIWCTYSFKKGFSKWREIRNGIPNPFYEKINTEIYHVESGYGKEQALMAVKSEMKNYIRYLLNLNKNN